MKSRRAISIGLLCLLAACAAPGDSAEPAASATEPATPEATGRTSRSAPAAEPCPTGELCNGRIAPGEYTTDALGATVITLTLESEWDAEVRPDAGYVNLYHQGDVPAIIGFATMPDEVFTDPCDDRTTEPIGQSSAEVVEWLYRHPAMETGEPEHVTLAGATGLRIEITASKAEPCPAASGVQPDIILLWPLSEPGSAFVLVDGTTAIFYALHVGDELVVVSAETIFDPEEWRPVVQQVLDSMEFAAD